ncbi:hypothetical protein AAFC00_003297 [Neodothiora populina]|uniref:ATP-dependent DNA ligase family profile domain-containing protein n=1 Tax=Neodothiora populina TaxID=2781224 RepID=A0ABR3PB52_9PEZI
MIKFFQVCGLLERLENIARHDPPYNSKEISEHNLDETTRWFKSNRELIDASDAKSSSAFLSTLLPHKRKDRVYGIQSATLVKILGRCLGLNASKRHDLALHKIPGNGDLGDCVERVLLRGGPPAMHAVSIVEVDDLMQCLASQNRFSAANMQAPSRSPDDREIRLKVLLLRMTAIETKWITRLILKDLSPATLDEPFVLRLFHFLICDILMIHNGIEAATKVLKTSFPSYPSQPDPQSRIILRQTAAASMRPIVGTMISRSAFCKARSIQHCLNMTAERRWLIDRKYDGEYCQIHVDLRNEGNWVRIYSKSGRDSTQDRKGLHDTIRECLRIGTDRCQIKRQCILVGEMVVYSETDKCIVSFDRIRNHVSRAGIFLGTGQDTPAKAGEHLMIVFFDLLLLDDENILNQLIEQRRHRLSSLYKKIDGRAQTSECTVIDFGSPGAERKLMHQFAASNALRHEGLVLKACDVPYLVIPSSGASSDTRPTCHAAIKLKKDYVAGMGDEADFAVIGASYSAQEANKRPELDLSWTHFHLGCLVNEADVTRLQVDPIFKIVGTISMDQCIPVAILQQINAEGKFFAERPASSLRVHADQTFQPDVYFSKPFVFEVLGSSFCRPSDSGFYMLRHPRVKKMHGDRSWRECITFDELQDAAQEALSAPMGSESQEKLEWMARLERSCKRKFAEISRNVTPTSARSVPTPRSMSVMKSRKREALEPTAVYEDDVQSSPLAPIRPLQLTRGSRLASQGIVPLPTPASSSPLRDRLPGTTNVLPEGRYSSTPSQVHERCLLQDENAVAADASGRNGESPQKRRHQGPKVVKAMQTAAKICPAQNGVPTKAAPGENNKKVAEDVREACRLFHNTVVYTAGDVEESKDLMQKLEAIGVTVVPNLAHWDRDSDCHRHLEETVSESQAFPGLQKVVLVDGKQIKSACSTVTKAMRLNRGHFRESIEFYDRRVAHVDEQSDRIGGGEANKQSSAKWKMGTLMYDEKSGRSRFVPAGVGGDSRAETTFGM